MQNALAANREQQLKSSGFAVLSQIDNRKRPIAIESARAGIDCERVSILSCQTFLVDIELS